MDEEDDENLSGIEQRRDSHCWEGVSAAKKEQLCLLWTKHLDKMEAQVVHMQDELQTNPAQTKLRQQPRTKTVNFLDFLSDVFFDPRHQLSLHKRRITLSYVRAIEHLGDMRLDLFAAFWYCTPSPNTRTSAHTSSTSSSPSCSSVHVSSIFPASGTFFNAHRLTTTFCPVPDGLPFGSLGALIHRVALNL